VGVVMDDRVIVQGRGRHGQRILCVIGEWVWWCGAEREVNFHTSLEDNVVVSEKKLKKGEQHSLCEKIMQGVFCNIQNAVELGHFYLLCVLLN
jgi:hypothetical protein